MDNKDINITPNIKLTVNSSVSSYGKPVLVFNNARLGHHTFNGAFGPGDYICVAPARGPVKVSEALRSWLFSSERTERERDMIRRFLSQDPASPQLEA